MKKSFVSFAVVLGAAIVFGAGCSSPSPVANPSPTPVPAERPSPSIAPIGSVSVSIRLFVFQPQTVSVAPGTSVTWTNNDSTAHTVTADDGSFDSGSLKQGASFTHVFTSAGTVAYHCTFHPGMLGTVTVR